MAARQFEAAGFRLLGVEPDERMAQWAGQCGLVVGVATFETWDPAGRTFDAVIEGQSWHWVEPVAGAVKAAAVLRPAGPLAVFRNDPQLPADLADAFAAAARRVLPATLADRLQ
ncbi:methyltransferase domain-containing protein, partial [Segeticoccus rhizosphaerae]|uniref:methyltransferase domain-containing protein n=1 Tax=Segeticoccus rhizosphaerae TaxID=1104777 RepID=UPI0030841966